MSYATSDKRIEALKDERRQLISAKQDLERRIDELCQENERLRQELAIRESSEQEKVIDYLGKECVDWEDKYLALAGENAKLQEDLEFERSENSWVREFLDRMGQKCGTKDCPSLVAYVTKLEVENAKLLKLLEDMRNAPCCGDYCWMELSQRLRDAGIEVPDE